MSTPDGSDEITPIPLDDLAATWRGLNAVAENYQFMGKGWEQLIMARRLVEIEIRDQHGDRAWEEITGQPTAEEES